MTGLFAFQSYVLLAIFAVVAIGTAWALVDALSRSPQSFVAADKQQKNTWLLILGIALAAEIVLNGSFLALFAGAIAMLVYHLDVRPAVSRMTRRR